MEYHGSLGPVTAELAAYALTVERLDGLGVFRRLSDEQRGEWGITQQLQRAGSFHRGWEKRRKAAILYGLLAWWRR